MTRPALPPRTHPPDDRPPGWSLNPSSWGQRLPLVAWAAAGFGISLYLALYQWRILPDVWEPFFGAGSRKILNSPISHVLPIPDAALGALGYLADAVTGAVGSRRRWRTMPWMVVIFGLAVGPLGAVSILLVVLQPVLFDAWCTLCLASAVISVIMISPTMDEVLASLQHLRRETSQGRAFWPVFWGRGAPEAEAPAPAASLPFDPRRSRPVRAAVSPWVAMVLGVWLMASPDVFGYEGAGRASHHIVGPLVASAGLMALWEFMRPVRWVNAAFGLWLTATAWPLYDGGAALNGALTGVLLLAASVRRETYRPERFGGGWSAAWKRAQNPAAPAAGNRPVTSPADF
jgi:uncharacterized membrane protein